MTNQPTVMLVGDDTVEWGVDCKIYNPSNIYRCKIGDRVRVGPFTEIQDGCDIGDDTVICSHAFLANNTVIGKRCFVGHGVLTCNDRNPIANNRGWFCERIVVGDDVSIGSGAILMPGVTIGNRCSIGAGAIVTKNVVADSIAYNKIELVVRSR